MGNVLCPSATVAWILHGVVDLGLAVVTALGSCELENHPGPDTTPTCESREKRLLTAISKSTADRCTKPPLEIRMGQLTTNQTLSEVENMVLVPVAAALGLREPGHEE